MTQPTVADALLAEFSYWKERFLDPSNDGGYPPDDDHSHALQQAILEAARREWREVFIGTRTGDKTEKLESILVRYTGQPVADWDFAVPVDNERLRRVVLKYRKAVNNRDGLKEIRTLVAYLGGINL